MYVVRGSALLGIVAVFFALARLASAQTASSGALSGVTLDPTGAALPNVIIHLAGEDIAQRMTAQSDQEGRFAVPLIPPGLYQVDATKAGFRPVQLRDIQILVTETVRLELHFSLSVHTETTEVLSETGMEQLDESALGRAVNELTVSGLPLVTRNFSQIASLSPGIATGVFNAGELGMGATASAQIGQSNDGIYALGARSYDNNWELDGISMSDVMGSGATSGGIPIPNPDTLKEFKVQTLYDASFGRGAGANVSVISKTGGNDYHGTIFEFLRNNVLNANDFFLKEAGQPRPDLKQNQFGFTFGGPIRKEKLFFFSSYQGTRQVNGLAAGQSRVACSGTVSEPPLTNDRSAAAIGEIFGGMSGALGGVAVKPDGSNINPAALDLLNFRLPDGSYLIPTPQTIDPSKPFPSQGFSVFSEPCTFSEDQFLFNADYNITSKNQLSARFFISDDDQLVTFPGSGLNFVGNVPGFDSSGGSSFLVSSLADTYTINSSSLSQTRIGFVRIRTKTSAYSPFEWSDVGVSEGSMNEDNELPNLSILGSVSMAPAFPRTYTQNGLSGSETVSLFRGSHTIEFGGSLARLMDNLDFAGFGSFVEFLSWPDFLLGLNANGNGTAFSNVFESADVFGLLNRDFRASEGSAFVQDNYKVKRSLTLTLGLRYERIGQFGDRLGRNSSFDFDKADRSPPADGSLDGYIVSSNFLGALPAGVERAGNTFGNYGDGQNAIAPRFGLAWQIPDAPHLVLRVGYGLYYSRPPGQVWTESVVSAPFALPRFSTGLANSAATFQTPFAQSFPTPASFPLFVPYSPSTSLSVNSLASDFRPAIVQQFSLNIQEEVHKGWLVELGYVGSRGTHLQRFRSLNQALSASPSDPVNGVTSNTLANIGLRVPVPGIRPDSLRQMESEGSSWYNGLEASLTKRLDHGIQFLASYTFSKTLDTDGAAINGTSAANTLTLGDQNSPQQRWGRASFDRTHRFVFSGTWALPRPYGGWEKGVLGGWNLAAIVTVQSGTALTIADTNANNVFGISEDRAQLTGTCRKNQIVTGGPIGLKLNDYFNASCFTTPPVIGADDVGTAFGNSRTGLVDGPGQANLDLAVSRSVKSKWPTETSLLELRAEFFNALNHPQFANPDSNFTSPTFGVINSTAVNPRVVQLAARLVF